MAEPGLDPIEQPGSIAAGVSTALITATGSRHGRIRGGWWRRRVRTDQQGRTHQQDRGIHEHIPPFAGLR
jgi:hypothetical protein